MSTAANLLLEQFADVLATPQDVERLKQTILDLAVHGKLTEQDPNDEPASELLARIKAEKKQSNGNPLLPIGEDEMPFGLPSGWSWARLGEIGTWANGAGFPHIYQGYEGLPYLFCKVSDMNLPGNEIWMHHAQNTIDDKLAEKIGASVHPVGTVIFPKIGGAIATNKRRILGVPAAIDNNCLGINPLGYCSSDWLYFLLCSIDFIKYQTGTSIPAINQGSLGSIVIGLPPLAEQNRIVVRIEQLFALTRRLSELLAEAQTDLTHLNESALAHLLAAETPEEFEYRWRFIAEHFHLLASDPAHIAPLRQTVLECAVRGMLTRQNPSDEPASELLKRIQAERVRLVEEGKLAKSDKLPPIGDDEKPFELPRGWEWVHLDDIADHRLGKMLDQHKNKGEYLPYLRNINVQWLRIDFNDVKELRFEDNEIEEYRLKVGDLLVCEGGEPGRCAIWENPDLEMMFQKAIHRVRPLGGILPKYTLYHLWADAQSGALDKYFTGATIKHFTGKALASYICALPPLAEQRRIVAKVEQLLTQCDALESKLGAAQVDRERLVQSVMAGIEAG